MYWALKFGFRMSVVLINASQVCLELLPNFHGENPTPFRLIFMAEFRQCFASDVSQHTKCYSHQAFDVRILQQGWPIFTEKIRQSFAFGTLWCTSRVSCLCILCVPTCSCQDEPMPFKALSTLIRAAYMGKLMSLGDMDQDSYTVVTMHTV